MFFVISGFIVSRIILDRKGAFDWRGFYLGRLKRIVPAYLATLAVVALAAAVLLIPQDFGFFRSSLKSALIFNSKDGLQDLWVRQHFGSNIALPCHLIPNAEAFVQATRLGMGWGMNPELMIAEDLRSGRLVPLHPASLDVRLYWQIARIMAPPLAPLTRAIRRAAAAALIQ